VAVTDGSLIENLNKTGVRLSTKSVRAVEGACLEIALTVRDGVLHISITVENQLLSGDPVYYIDPRKPQ
jgi:hypothetical protein